MIDESATLRPLAPLSDLATIWRVATEGPGDDGHTPELPLRLIDHRAPDGDPHLAETAREIVGANGSPVSREMNCWQAS